MCGIYITNIPYEKEIVEAKLKSIAFRGPDNLGYQKVDEISIGHLRLSILDLDSRSNQPYSFNNFKITYNGEIYNFLDIKKELLGLGYIFETTSDTEVLIKGFSEWGQDLLPKINGMFAFAIYDTTKRKIFCARDRVGVKPFFYYWRDGKFEICSQLRPLINSESKVSGEAVSIYLDCGYVPSPYSIIEDVYKLPPGNFMEMDLNNGTKTITEYWNLKAVTIRDITYEEAKEELHQLLIDAVAIRMQSDVPLGSFLSGGIDSALVSAIASKISKDPINTFTIGFEDPKYDESKVAKQFSKIIGSNHAETICEPNDALQMLKKLVEVYDEPFADSSALPSLLLNSITKEYVTVALTGDGGDESFLGYHHFDSVNEYVRIEKIPFFIKSIFSKLFSLKVVPNRYRHFSELLKLKSIEDFINAIFIGYNTLQKDRKKSWLLYYKGTRKLSSNSIQNAADLNIKLWLENDSNVKVDRASMGFSVETRSPFLDYRIIEFARTLPVDFRYLKGNKKRILKDILCEYIPQSVFEQPKRGFSIPLGKWISGDLRKDIVNELNNDFLLKVPNLNISLFEKQLKNHMSNVEDNSFNIWKLYLLAKWCKEFGISLKSNSELYSK